MTKKRNLTTFMIAIMIMLFSLPVNAQGKVGYAQWDELNTTLTFKGGGSVPEGAYALNNSYVEPSWSNYTACTKVVFDESFKDVRPTSCCQWFGGFEKLTTIQGIENLNTEEVTNMSYMFYRCSGLTSLDLSSFNTAEVKDMVNMFGGCSGLTSLDLSSFNTAKVENMAYMFDFCSRLTSFDLSSFNTAKVTDMCGMFINCSGLTTIYVSDDFKIGDDTNGLGMFYDCTSLEKGDVSYDPDKTDHTMANCISGYFTKSNLTPYVKWDASTNVLTFKVANNKENGSGVYYLNEGAGAPGWSIDDVKNNCTKVVFTPSFNHARPTSCFQWFNNFERLTTIEGIENLNTEEVKNMNSMFYCCKKLTSLDLSSFNTATVENMSCMFSGCSSLTSLDLASFNTAKVGEMYYMFSTCSSLTTIYVSDAFTINKDCESNNMFSGCTSLEGATSYAPDKTDKSMANFDGYFTPKIITPYVKWDGDTKVLTFKVANTKEEGNGVYDLNEGENKPKWVDEVSGNCTKVVFTTSFNHAKPTSCNKWFNSFSQLTTIESIENLNTEDVTYMNSMFSGCSGLKSLDLSSFNTAKVTDMSNMFAGCQGLTSLDLSSFNTAEVTDMGGMFNGCSDLTKIYVSDVFTIVKVSSSENMFYNCTNLVGDASYDPTKTGIDMANLDGYFTKSNLMPYVKWNADTKVLTFKVANTKEEGSGVYDLNKDANDPGWNINEVYNKCTNVVFTRSFNHARPTSCYKWFNNFTNLIKIEGIENLNTEKVTNMSDMFRGCKNITSLVLSSFNTAEVTTMNSIFYGCSGLTSLDLSNFNTANVTDMNSMFHGCSGLNSLNLSKFKTANVTDMNSMFRNCSGLNSLNLSKFKTANVTEMGNMFLGCSGLTSLDLSSFNTDNVRDMSYMFKDCSGLTSLNLSSFNTDNVTNMTFMFKGCPGLTSLDLSSFNTTNVTDMKYMFNGCSGLESLDVSNFNTANVTNMSDMFNGCSGLTSLDLSSFNTANVTKMSYMLNGCSGLKSLDVSNFNTANVTNMSNMLNGCSGLTSLDLSSFNTAEVTDMSRMFNNCSGLTTIYVSDGFTIVKVSSTDNMFVNCTSLEGATSWDSYKPGLSMANYKTGYFKTYFTLGEKKVELCGEQLTTNSLNLNLTGDDDFVAHAPFTANEATYSRDLSTSGSTWFSLCLPFAYTPDNFTAYKLKGATEKAVEIEEITGEIVAGTPVLFKFKDGAVKEINLSATGANIVKAPVEGATVTGDDGSSLQLCGTYQTKTFSSEDRNAFILLNNKLMNPAKMLENKNVSKVSVKPFRAYMTLTASAEATPEPASARAFSIGRGGEGDEGTSAIDLLNSVATDDAEYYDINGRRIDAPAKGVNIVRRGNKTIKLIIK